LAFSTKRVYFNPTYQHLCKYYMHEHIALLDERKQNKSLRFFI